MILKLLFLFYFTAYFKRVALLENNTNDRIAFCNTLDCSQERGGEVCGLRAENNGFRVKVFDNVCLLLKYGCEFGKENEFGMTDMDLCNKALNTEDILTPTQTTKQIFKNIEVCHEKYECKQEKDNKFQEICAIRNDGNGFRVRTFQNECELLKYNCINKAKFLRTEYFYCRVLYPDGFNDENDLESVKDYRRNENNPTRNENDGINTKSFEIKNENGTNILQDAHESNTVKKTKTTNDNLNKVKVRSAILVDNLNYNGNINDSIDTYFKLTHARKLKLKKISIEDRVQNETRRMVIKKIGPLVLYKAVSDIPANTSNGTEYVPTLGTCFHKCPKQCPDTYLPVCAQPGEGNRAPSLVFVNHCYMDQAQCKLYRQNVDYAPTYIESQFYFCVGVEYDALYRFFPIVRTLQKLGRIKRKGKFQYKVRNFKNYNQFLKYNPRVMG